ncbi:unnamed protein product [Lasius platythorax]|uniref:Endonuclease/exonuclease/phosphatase domain-containing protein n=1 Tax=Lasius platythorax TaxID=488582 RepID=A0AAV2NFT6_9HYME
MNEVEIITGYRTMFTHELSNIMRKSVCNERIIIGDFNCDSYNEGGFLVKHLNELHFKRAICTQVSTTKFNTQIDVIFISEGILNYSAGVYETYFSDHKPIFIGLNEQSKIPISSVKMFEIFTEDTFSCKEKHNSEEELINVMSVYKNEKFRIDNEECVILNNEIEENNMKPVTTSLEGRTELFSRNKNIMYLRNQYKSYREKCRINTVNTVENYPPLQTLEENVLEENSWLDDRPLNEIMKIIKNNTLFYRVDVLFITGLHWVDPIFTPDVQIVGGNQAGNHWH